MMKFNKYVVILSVISFLNYSCENKNLNKNSIEGLWLVEKVNVGKDEMTPIARWMQFNIDSTQVSGNGWLKHSFGSWSLNDKNQLKINNLNGLSDDSEPFLINLEKDKMIWRRIEENQKVQVFLKRINKLPTSSGNNLMGLWKLESYKKDEKDITNKENPKNNQTLYLSWDNVYREHNLLSGRKVGVYKIHGHKPELQMVNYGKNPQFNFWNFSLIKNKLILISRDNKTIKTYRRIYKFLQ